MPEQNVRDQEQNNDTDTSIILHSKMGLLRPSNPYYTLALWLAPELTVEYSHG